MRGFFRLMVGLSGILMLGAMVPGTLAAGGVPPVVQSSGADLQQIDVTVYNSNLALVREVRRIDLPRGDFTLEYRGVPSSIQPTTLLVSADPDAGLLLYDQNYEYDLMTPDKILQKYVGRDIAWIQEDGSRITGRLLGVNSKPVYQVGNEILFEVPGRIVLPRMPANLRAQPTLVWNAHADKGGATTVETSYLAGGMNWHCDYVLQLDRAGRKAGLQAWVSLDNRSGAGFRDANLMLVAGDINRAAPENLMREDMVPVKAMAAPPRFQEESLYDYHLYTLDRPVDLKNQQTKQVSLFERQGVKVIRKYRLDGSSRFFHGFGRMQSEGKVKVLYSFENSADNKLGLPMPAGVVRIYGLSSAGGRQLLGEDRIGHTPQDETIELTAGSAFDVVAERVREKVEKISDRVTRNSFRITLRNHKDEDITVEVREPVGGQWEVLQSSFPVQRLSANEMSFQVPVKAHGEAVLTYRVEVRY